MMEFLKFTFQDLVHFLGVCLLIVLVGEALASIVRGARR